jgi:phage tail-like protein
MPPPAAGPGAGPRPMDPLITPRYKVEFSKLTGVFTDVGIASAEVTPVAYQYTGSDGQPGYLTQPGQRKPPTITLKRGMTTDLSAWNWHKEAIEGGIAAARCNGTISILDVEGKPAAAFNVINAWPVKVSTPALASSGNTPAVEEIQLACEGFTRSS